MSRSDDYFSGLLKRDEEKWSPVFRETHATTRNPERDDVSIKHHPALVRALRGLP